MKNILRVGYSKNILERLGNEKAVYYSTNGFECFNNQCLCAGTGRK